MKIILINIPTEISSFLAQKFLYKGQKIFLGKSPGLVEKFLSENKQNLIIAKINNYKNKNQWIDLLVRLKQDEQIDGEIFKLVILSSERDSNFIQMALLLNTIGFIPENLSNQEIYERLEKIFTLNHFSDEKRQFQRISPDEEDNVNLSFIITSTGKYYIGKIINLTIKGVAFKLTDNAKYLPISEGKILGIRFNINRRMIQTELKIIFIRDNIVGGLFDNPSYECKNIIGQYILECLSKLKIKGELA